MLFREIEPQLRFLAQRQMDPTLAARVDESDILQNTNFEIARDITKFRGTTVNEFEAWIATILRNNVKHLVHKHILAQKRSIRKERRIDPIVNDNESRPKLPLPAKQSTPSQRAMRGEAAIRLSRELAELPHDQATAIRLRHLEGYSLQQLTEHFQRSESAVAGLLKRGLRTLRERLRDYKKLDERGA